MYGLIIDHIITYIREAYGEDVWTEVKYVADVEQDYYVMDEVYSEGLPHKLIWATHEVTSETIENLNTAIGYSFYKFLEKYEFHKILRVLGRTFPEFLNGLDNLHEYLRFSFPKLKPPSFFCEHESRTGLTLHYRSKRRGYVHYVKGQIKNIALDLFHTEVEIEMLDHEHENSMEHVIMRLHFNNSDYGKLSWFEQSLTPELKDKIKITSDIFFDIFPFIIVFNRGMKIRNVGIGLLRVTKNLVGKKMNQAFVLMRPFIRFRWEEVMNYSNNIFELMSADPIWEDEEELSSYTSTDPERSHFQKVHIQNRHGHEGLHSSGSDHWVVEERQHMSDKERVKFLVLKGQMFYMEDWESICFMGIPVMQNLSQMYKSGLYINDFAVHDSSRDLVLASTQQHAEIKLLQHQEEQKSRNMIQNIQRLRRERRKTETFLYHSIPEVVAQHLKNGESALTYCEKFDSVTVMVANIVDFSKFCTTSTPMTIVSFLNDMYNDFDAHVRTYGVIKMQTLGDVYLVACGCPTKTLHHAEYILDCGQAFLNSIMKFAADDSSFSLKMRIGIHTGPVVTGIIGAKLPRYAIFGETIDIANAMERKSKSMKMQVTDATVHAIESASPDIYTFAEHGTYETKTFIYKRYIVGERRAASKIAVPERAAEEEEHEQAVPSVSMNGRHTPTSIASDVLREKTKLAYNPVSEEEVEKFAKVRAMDLTTMLPERNY